MLQFIGFLWQGAVIRDLFLDYSRSVVGLFIQGQMPVMWNACIPVLMILLIAVSSNEEYI